MPYENQRATGESLIALEQSAVFKEFQGSIRIPENSTPEYLEPTQIAHPDREINRVLAIDGSIITERVRNGFPGAEASLVQIALVSIDLTKLNEHRTDRIIPPNAFSEMDRAATLQCVLPGCNIVHNDGTQPREFFRLSVYEALLGSVQKGHETLLETYRAIVSDRTTEFACPEAECVNKIKPQRNTFQCACNKRIRLFETDPLRFHERFREVGTNGEAHGEVMRFLEVILLLNVLRYFISSAEATRVLPRIAFVMDGPLAAFGQFAAVVPYVQAELFRINQECEKANGEGLLLFSLIKTGEFVEHFEQLDHDERTGPNRRYSPRSALLPDIQYIHRNIVCRAPDAKPWGEDTYFGRMVLYKSSSGQRMVVNTPKISDESLNLTSTKLTAFPRLADSLKILDRLSTYLFQGGFVPIVRAHSHAAIPLKMGGEILKNLFSEE